MNKRPMRPQSKRPMKPGIPAGIKKPPVKEPPASSPEKKVLNERTLAPGEFVFRENDPGDYGYVVVSGSIDVCKITNGEYSTLIELEAGSLFGEMAIIDKAPRSAAARAKTEAVVREVDEAALTAHFTKTPEHAISMMRKLSGYVRTSNQALEKDVFDSTGVAETPEIAHDSLLDKLGRENADNAYIINSFQNPVDSLAKSRVPPVVNVTFWAGFLLMVAFVLWASFSIIDTTVSASGKITTMVPKIAVQSGESSTVKSVHVSPGQVVKAGDVLITLDPTMSDADYAQMKQGIEENMALVARLRMEKQGALLSEVMQLSHPLQRDIFRDRQAEHYAKLRSIDLGIEKAESSLETAKLLLENARLSKSNARFILESAEIGFKKVQHNATKQQRLVNEGILSPKAMEEEQFKIDEAKQKVQTAKNGLETASNSFKEAQIYLEMSRGDLDTKLSDRQSFLSGRSKQINEELVEAIAQQDSKHEELIKLEHQRTNIQIIAPTSGVVLEIQDVFVGAIINAGQAVITLVPVDVPLTIEMDIEPKDISNLVVGNILSAKLSALPFQKHGDLTAKISFLSEDTVDESINGEAGSFYRARAEITANNLQKTPDKFRLVPGMQLSGDIRVAKRRVITYFLYPVIKTLETSFTEP